MTEKQKNMPRNRAVTLVATVAGVLLGILLLAQATGVLPTADAMSPPVAIGFCALASVIVLGLSIWYFARTDEHDLHANLWAMTWGWIATVLLGANWVILHGARLAPPPHMMVALLVDGAVSVIVWLWMRYR